MTDKKRVSDGVKYTIIQTVVAAVVSMFVGQISAHFAVKETVQRLMINQDYAKEAVVKLESIAASNQKMILSMVAEQKSTLYILNSIIDRVEKVEDRVNDTSK